MKELPSQEKLKEYLAYNPETGEMSWIKRLSKQGTQTVGKPIYHPRSNYTTIFWHYNIYPMHRVIYKWMTGEEPNIIDHINRNKKDNRWCNLRNCTQSQNGANVVRVNKWGATGVSLVNIASGRRWRARICVDSKKIELGFFVCPLLACMERLRANKKYFDGFTLEHI